MTPFEILGRRIGAGFPVYVVAEVSANHNQSLDRAVELVEAAIAAGADAIKLQTYTPDTITLECDRPEFRIASGTIWDGKTLYDLYREAYTPWEWHAPLKAIADRAGVAFFSSPFDETAIDFLAELQVPAYKIASFELVDLPLVRRAARKGKPLIMSTGMASLAEIDEAMRAARGVGASSIALLKTNSAYPAPAEEMNLRTIPHLSESFGVPVGLSDHTLGSAVAVAAVALGACIIEKHICLSRKVPGPDSAFSMEPSEFREMVDSIRVAEKAVGGVSYDVTPKQRSSIVYRRSLFVVRDVRAGQVLTEADVRSIRPGHGLPTKYYEEVIGRKAAVDIGRGTPVSWSLLA